MATAAWAALETAKTALAGTTLTALFAADPDRFQRFSRRLDDLLVDFSKERIDAVALEALVALARETGVAQARDALFSGKKINATEDRAVLHMALRDGTDPNVAVEGNTVTAQVRHVRERMLAFADAVRSGGYGPVGGGRFTDVINIGIGGSDLGPACAVAALRRDADGPRLHFVSNVDGAHLTDTIADLDPATTLVIVASKTFTTAETMTNARSARNWLAGALGDQAGAHMAAVSTNLTATADFGIADSRVFGFWDWVGGRYSVWSAIGLPVAIAIGSANFERFLAGAAAMDRHFLDAPLEENLPVLLALIGIWRRNVMGWPTVALIPYDQRLERFPAYVQQLDMESNGKRVRRDGSQVEQSTAPVIWGEPGTNAQHSFFQLIHQGTDIVPVDFIAAANPREDLGDHHAQLLANCLAQSQALAFGRSEDAVRAEMTASGLPQDQIDALAPHRTFPGNRPSTTILYRQLDPYALGRLIALYEHKVFVQGVIWGINSFDQWGVELGKALAKALVPALKDWVAAEDVDGSTAGLIAAIADWTD